MIICNVKRSLLKNMNVWKQTETIKKIKHNRSRSKGIHWQACCFSVHHTYAHDRIEKKEGTGFTLLATV